MATTGELRAIIQELHLVDAGDAASYLGEEKMVEGESSVPVESLLLLSTDADHLVPCECVACRTQ
jgi:hypothetical protein